MKEKELIFDRKKHVCYSEAVKKVIQNRLKSNFRNMKLKNAGKKSSRNMWNT